MRRRNVDMLSGSIVKGLLAVAVPIMIMNVVNTVFNIVDMTVLRLYDPNGLSVGAVGVSGMLISLITGLVIGVSAGADVVVARHIGQQDQPGVDRAVGSALAFSLTAGAGIGILGVACAEVFLRWTNCPEELLEQGALYFRMYFAGVPLLTFYNFCAAILRSSGDSRRPMIFLLTGGVSKIVLDLVFVGWLGMGVMGVAVATIISWAVAVALVLWALIRNGGVVALKLKNIRFYKKEICQILRIGVPAGLQQGLYSFANVAISAAVNTFGPLATTGISIANNLDGVLYQISTATAFAVMPYVSQNIGCGNIRRAMQSVWKGVLITVCLGGGFGALSAIFSRELSSIMSTDPTVIAYSQQKMVIVSSTYFICGINELLSGALRSMGRPVSATVTTLVFLCALRFVWVYWVFPLLPHLSFLYLVWPIGWILSIVTLLVVFFPTAKKLYKTAAALPPDP